MTLFQLCSSSGVEEAYVFLQPYLQSNDEKTFLVICIISLFDILFVFIQSAVCKEKIKGPKDFDVFFSAQLKSFGAKLKHLCVVTLKMAAAVYLYCLLFKGKGVYP